MKQFNEYMTVDEIEARVKEIEAELNNEDANVSELSAEFDGLEARKAEVLETLADEQKKATLRAAINGEGKDVSADFKPQEGKTMKTMQELRNDPRYIEAFANDIKKGDEKFTETRALIMTENVDGGTVVVPTSVEAQIVTAWEKSAIFARIRKVNGVKNYKVNFEISGTAAYVHTEGAERGDMETLTLGAVEIIPRNIKKWIEVTDEVLSMSAVDFLAYLYDEFANKIVKAAEGVVIAAIIAQVGASTATQAGQATVAGEPTKATVLDAIASTSDEATDLIIVLNKRTYAEFKKGETLNSGDVFDGIGYAFNNDLPAYADADEEDPYAIVGDFGYGARAVLPDGENIKYIVDEKSKAPDDVVVITGKLLCGLGIVAQNAFCVITKPEAEEEQGEG